MEEVVDIIDAENNILYSVAKTEAHAKGLLHRTVIGEIRNSKGDFTLVKQASDRQDPGQYVSPVGGHVKSEESEVDALKRETKEEVGLLDFKYKLVGRFVFDRKVLNRHENHMFVVYEIFTEEKLDLGPEAVSYRTFTKEELVKELSTNRSQFGGAYLCVVNKFYPYLLEKK